MNINNTIICFCQFSLGYGTLFNNPQISELTTVIHSLFIFPFCYRLAMGLLLMPSHSRTQTERVASILNTWFSNEKGKVQQKNHAMVLKALTPTWRVSSSVLWRDNFPSSPEKQRFTGKENTICKDLKTQSEYFPGRETTSKEPLEEGLRLVTSWWAIHR